MARLLDANAGWIKLYRQLLDKPIWSCSTNEQKVIFITMLLLANHAEKQWMWKGEKFTCCPGQFVTSLPSLAKESGCSIQNVRTALKRFKNLEFLTEEVTGTGRLITIVNWETYQAKPFDLTDDLTDNQQTPNRPLTPNKNDKKGRKKEGDEYTPEFESWWKIYPHRKGDKVKHGAFKNFEKIRKSKGLDFINKCTQNYIDHINSKPEKERDSEYNYAAHNFFGQKAYYLDFIEPKTPGKAKTASVVPLGGAYDDGI